MSMIGPVQSRYREAVQCHNNVIMDYIIIKQTAVQRSKVKEIIVLIKARSFLDELNLEHLTS